MSSGHHPMLDGPALWSKKLVSKVQFLQEMRAAIPATCRGNSGFVEGKKYNFIVTFTMKITAISLLFLSDKSSSLISVRVQRKNAK